MSRNGHNAEEDSQVQPVAQSISQRMAANEAQTKSAVEAYVKDNRTPPEGDVLTTTLSTGTTTRTRDFEDIRVDAVGEAKRAFDIRQTGYDIYTKAIEHLEEAKDARTHIKRTVMEPPHADGTRDLIRDARNALYPPIEGPEVYTIQCLNVARAAEKLLDQALDRGEITKEKANEARTAIRKQVQEQVLSSKKGDEQINYGIKKQVPAFNDKIAKALKKSGLKKEGKFSVKDRLKAAKEFNFDGTHYHTSTISTRIDSDRDTRIVVESQNMMLGQTDNLRKMYQAIKDHGTKQGPVPNPTGTDPKTKQDISIDMKWFNDQPKSMQDMIRSNIDHLIKGDMVIGTQLRETIPELRNAYVGTVLLFDKDATQRSTRDPKAEVVVRSPHTGTLSFHGEGDKGQASMLAAEKLREVNGKKTTQTTLVTPLRANDRRISELTGQAMDAVGGSKATAPANGFRRLGGAEFEPFQVALTEVASKLKTEPQIAAFLKGEGSEKAARIALNTLLESPEQGKKELGVALYHAIEAKQLMNEGQGLRDSENRNLQITSHMALISDQANREGTALNGLGIDVNILSKACQSGKDRAAVSEVITTNMAVDDKLGLSEAAQKAKPQDQRLSQDELDKIKETNAKSQAAAGAMAHQAGGPGGGIGNYGLKKDSLGSLPKKLGKFLKHLFQNAASYNKLKMPASILKPKTWGEAVKNLYKKAKAAVLGEGKPKESQAISQIISNSGGMEAEGQTQQQQRGQAQQQQHGQAQQQQHGQAQQQQRGQAQQHGTEHARAEQVAHSMREGPAIRGSSIGTSGTVTTGMNPKVFEERRADAAAKK